MAHSAGPSASFQATTDAKDPRIAITEKDRRYQVRKLFVIGLISIVTIVLTIIEVAETAISFEKKTRLVHKIQGSIETAYVIHQLQKERSLTTLQFGFKQLNFDEHRLKLSNTRHETDESIMSLERRDDTNLEHFIGRKSSLSVILEEFRSKIDNGEANVIEHLRTYKYWISILISTLANYIKSQNLEDIADLVYAYQMIILSKEEAGMEHALGTYKFIKGENFSIINTTWYNEKRVLAENYLKTAFLFSSEVKKTYSMLLKNNNNTQMMKRIEKGRWILSSKTYNKSSEVAAYEWFELMTKYNYLMLKLQKRQADLIEARANKEIYHSTKNLGISAMLLCFSLFVVPCAILSLAKVQRSLYQYTLSLFDKVALEQGKTDFLMRQNARNVDGKCNCMNVTTFKYRSNTQPIRHLYSARENI